MSEGNGRKTKPVPMQPYAAELHYGNYVGSHHVHAGRIHNL